MRASLGRWDMSIRRWLCHRYGHKFYCGSSGFYPGMPQAHCWRCGIARREDHPLPNIEPLGRWFS